MRPAPVQPEVVPCGRLADGIDLPLEIAADFIHVLADPRC